MIEAAGKFGIKKMNSASLIYNTGYIPHKMREASFILIPKKNGALGCGEHRTVSIMSQLDKIISRIIGNRIKNKIDLCVGE